MPLAGLRILVVEDEFLVAMELSRMIRELGAEVVGPVSTVAAATELLQRSQVEGAVLDIKLGHESSAAVADDLRARGVPVVVTTGYAEEMLPQSLADAPRLAKPYTKRDFQELATRHFCHR
jgi:CheY-like chemotaxis protein